MQINTINIGHIILFSVIAGNLSWLLLKLICKNKGYPISLFVNHQWDIKNSIQIVLYDENIFIRFFTGLALTVVLVSITLIVIAIFYELVDSFINVA